VVTYLSKIVEVDNEKIVAHRLVEDGYEVLEAALPAVITVVKEAADPRLPTLRGKRKARSTDIPVWSPADLGVRPEDTGLKGSPTRVVKIFRPKVARECKKVPASDEQSVQEAVAGLTTFLQEKELL